MTRMMKRCAAGILAVALTMLAGVAVQASPVAPGAGTPVRVHIDAGARGVAFPHFWETMFGSGHAALALRADYRADLTLLKQATGVTYVRAHGILDREVGVFHLNKKGEPVYNFSYVDQIYDGLLAHGVKPFVELSFMPPDLDSHPDAAKPFFYHLRASPPTSYRLWDDLITTFARHLVRRYGIKEVSSWYFEVWNEPNIAFWNGTPAQATYFKLYDHTARDLKSVSPRLRVGGPATAAAKWVPAFLEHVHTHHVPVDFVSTHAYGNPCPAVKSVHEQIKASPYPHLPFFLSEFNVTIYTAPNMLGSVFMGPYLAKTIRQCAGNVDMMSYWTFSDVFEEHGVARSEFFGGYGLIAQNRIPKPAFNAFAMLHKLGRTRLPVDGGPVLATRREDGSVVLALWNYAPAVSTQTTYAYGSPKGSVKHFVVDISHLSAAHQATVWRLDHEHGNVVTAFNAMHRPDYPTRRQIRMLRRASRMPPPVHVAVHDGTFRVDVSPQGLVVVRVK